MNSLCFSIVFILSLVSLQVLGLTKILCALEDVDCIRRSTTIYPIIVAGKPDIGIPSLEPIYVDLIEGKTSTLNYTLSDAYVHGMKECHPEILQFELKNMTWYFYLICPRLEVDSNYYIYGDIDSVHLEGQGKCNIIYDDYHIAILAKYEKYNDNEGKVHINTKSFVLDDLDVKGGITCKFDNLLNVDNEESDLSPDVWKKLDTVIRKPMMEIIMGNFVDNTNIYNKAHSVPEMFYRNV